jgi:MFS family permease
LNEAPEDRRLRHTAIAVLATCFVLNMLGRGSGDTYIVFIGPLEREFGWSRSQLTGIYSVYLLVAGGLAPLVGMFFDRYGPRLVYTTGLACLAVAYVLGGFLTSLWQFYAFMGVMVGIGSGLAGMVPASGLLVRWFRTRLSTAMGIAFAATGMGSLTFVPLAQAMLVEYDWRMTYRILGGGMLLLVPVVALAIPWKLFAAGHPAYQTPSRLREMAAQGWTLGAAMKTPLFWALARVFFFTSLGMFTVIVQSVVFFIDAGFSPLVAAAAFGVTGMLSVVSVAASGPLADRFGIRRTVGVSFAGSALGVALLLGLSFKPWLVMLCSYVLIFGLCQGMRGPIVSSVTTRHFAGPRVATIYGMIFTFNAFGSASGSVIGGALHDLTGGYRAGFLFALCSMAIAVTTFWTVPALRKIK